MIRRFRAAGLSGAKLHGIDGQKHIHVGLVVRFIRGAPSFVTTRKTCARG